MVSVVVKFGRGAVPKAALLVKKGGLIVFPTDTVYGLGCDPFDVAAVERLFRAKRRRSRPIPVLCSSEEKAKAIVSLGGRGTELAKKYWPGALTIVAPTKRPVPRMLDQGSGTLGVRVPAHPLCRELLTACGGWLTGTSANLSGAGSSATVEGARSQLGDQVELYLDGGPASGTESTVVKVVGDEIIVLRQGKVGVSDARKWE